MEIKIPFPDQNSDVWWAPVLTAASHPLLVCLITVCGVFFCCLSGVLPQESAKDDPLSCSCLDWESCGGRRKPTGTITAHHHRSQTACHTHMYTHTPHTHTHTHKCAHHHAQIYERTHTHTKPLRHTYIYTAYTMCTTRVHDKFCSCPAIMLPTSSLSCEEVSGLKKNLVSTVL